MFRVDESIVFKGSGDQKIMEFFQTKIRRGKSEVQGQLLSIFVSFGYQVRSQCGSISGEKCSLGRSGFLMIFTWMGGSIWLAAEVDPLETLRVSIQSEYSV